MPGAAMLDGVAQGLLHDAIQAQGRVLWYGAGHVVVGKFDRQTVAQAQFPAQAADGRLEPELLQL